MEMGEPEQGRRVGHPGRAVVPAQRTCNTGPAGDATGKAAGARSERPEMPGQGAGLYPAGIKGRF